MFQLGSRSFDEEDLLKKVTPSMIEKTYEEEAYNMDRNCFYYGRAVSSAITPVRTPADYDFSRANFDWRPIATKGCGNGGVFVAVKPRTREARRLMYQRNDIWQFQFPRLDVRTMIKSKNRFFELIDVLWFVVKNFGSGGGGWVKWDGDDWLRRFSKMELQSWRAVNEETSEIKEIAQMAGSIPRLRNLQALILVGMGGSQTVFPISWAGPEKVGYEPQMCGGYFQSEGLKRH